MSKKHALLADLFFFSDIASAILYGIHTENNENPTKSVPKTLDANCFYAQLCAHSSLIFISRHWTKSAGNLVCIFVY